MKCATVGHAANDEKLVGRVLGGGRGGGGDGGGGLGLGGGGDGGSGGDGGGGEGGCGGKGGGGEGGSGGEGGGGSGGSGGEGGGGLGGGGNGGGEPHDPPAARLAMSFEDKTTSYVAMLLISPTSPVPARAVDLKPAVKFTGAFQLANTPFTKRDRVLANGLATSAM